MVINVKIMRENTLLWRSGLAGAQLEVRIMRESTLLWRFGVAGAQLEVLKNTHFYVILMLLIWLKAFEWYRKYAFFIGMVINVEIMQETHIIMEIWCGWGPAGGKNYAGKRIIMEI